MRGLYFVKENLDIKELAGVRLKVYAQVNALERYGYEMFLCHATNEGFVLLNIKENTRKQITLPDQKKQGFRKTLFLSSHFSEMVGTKDFQFMYIRYSFFSPFYLHLMRNIRRQNPHLKIFFELPCFPYRGLYWKDPSWTQKMKGVVDMICAPWIGKYVDYIVTFSRQDTIYGAPTLVTDNGIDPNKIEHILPTPRVSKTIRMIAVANLNFWHGYDRILHGLKQYVDGGGTPPVRFEIVGGGNELEFLQGVAKELDLMDWVTFHGFQSGEALTKLYQEADIAIGSLGMHRLGVEGGQTTTLKAREYCARGIPFIIGYYDHDFQDDFPFCITVEANENPVDIQSLVEWINRVRSEHTDFSHQMRTYAEEKLSWVSKLNIVQQAISTEG